MPPPSSIPKYIYKIVPEDPRPLNTGLPVSELDRKDGFIHLSTAKQVPKTVARFFKDADIVYLLKVPYAKVESKIIWEGAAAGTFPHIYDEDLSKSLHDGNVTTVLECRRDGGLGWDGVVEKVIEEAE
jgi:uncharacterized protein (DUF952 family)